MTDDKRPLESRNIDEDELREDPEFFERIGPAEEHDEQVIEGLNDYGYDQMDESTFEGDVTNEADQPDWLDHVEKERNHIAHDEEEEISDEDLTQSS